MRYGKIMVCLLTACFLAVAAFFWSRESEQAVEIPVSVTVSGQDGAEALRCWDSGDGAYYVFLPSGSELSRTYLRTEKPGVFLNGLRVTDGMDCGVFALDTAYELRYEQKGENYLFTLIFTRSAEVPALYLDVRSGSMDYIHETKGNQESGRARLYTEDGGLAYSGEFAVLEGRGSSTWGGEKKPYDLELRQEADLLGMGAAKNWVLLANDMDNTQIRNKLVYDFAAELGLPYSPECRWVDLYLNGEYAGLYLLCEKNEIHPERVDIAENGSFLTSKEWEWRMEANGQQYIQLDSRAALRLRDVSMDTDEVRRIWQSAENAILAEGGIDPVTGRHWREMIDVDSWALKYLIEEVFGNVDGGTLSQFFYYDGAGDGKIYAGPVWDYDLTMGNTFAWPYPAVNMFYGNRDGVYASEWFCTLYEDAEFYGRMVELYETRFQPLLEDYAGRIDAYAKQVRGAAKMNSLRWAKADPAAETAQIRDYLMGRMEFLDSIWVRGEETVTVMVSTADGTLLRYEVRPGETIPTLPAQDGWYDKMTDMPFDVSQPVYEDTAIYYKAESQAEAEEETEESPSLLRLGPAGVFLGMMAVVFFWDRMRNKRLHKIDETANV